MKKFFKSFLLTTLAILMAMTLFFDRQLNRMYLRKYVGQNTFRVSKDNGAYGTAFRVYHNGKNHIITNAHVCGKAKSLNFHLKFISYKLKVKKIDPKADLCELENTLDGLFDFLPLYLSPLQAFEGQLLSIIGFPGVTVMKTLTRGEYVGFSPKYRGEITTIPIFPGNSGSPVVNDFGLVVGVVNRYIIVTRDAIFIDQYLLKTFLEVK